MRDDAPAVEKETLDRVTIDLPHVQQDILKALKLRTNIDIVLVLINGGPVAIDWEKKNLDTIVEAFYPGELGGIGISDVLFGDYNPSGRLPVTIYKKNFVDLSDFGDYSMSKFPGRTYRYLQVEPLYEFGYGLSYTTFDYQWYSAPEPRKASANVVRTVSLKVTNTGDRDGDHVVPMYISGKHIHDSLPIKELKGFKKFHLSAGESEVINFQIGPEHLIHYVDGQRQILAGTYKILIGNLEETIEVI